MNNAKVSSEVVMLKRRKVDEPRANDVRVSNFPKPIIVVSFLT